MKLVHKLDELVLMYWGDLLTFEEIGQAIGEHYWHIKHLFKQYDVPRMSVAERARYKRELDFDRLYQLHVLVGKSFKQIHKETGLSPQYVRKTLQEKN